jgi:hypothetical protein
MNPAQGKCRFDSVKFPVLSTRAVSQMIHNLFLLSQICFINFLIITDLVIPRLDGFTLGV